MDDEMESSIAATADLSDRTSVRVLGPLAVVHEGRELHVAGTQRRRLLAFLASRPGQPTSVDVIVDVLWPDDPPRSAAKTVQSHVVRLRRSLSPLGDPIATVQGGYRLDVEPDAVDSVRFEALLRSARSDLADGRPTRARALLREALAMWRGTPYIEATGASVVDAERVRLVELRLAATEDLAESELLAGAAAAAVPELERLVTAEPGRERAWALLMRGHYALGRQHDALQAFQRARRVLIESFGLEPGPALRALERQVLEHDPALAVVPQRGPLPVPLRTDTPFVGREAELAWLQDAWSVARTGTGQVRVIGGSPGSGRTELAAALARLVTSTGGASVEYVRVADGLDRMAGGGDTALPGGVVDVVTDRCREAPLLLVLDDVDAAPASALPVIEALAEAAARMAILLVLIADRAVGGPAAAAMHRIEQTVATTIELDRMSDTELLTILRADGADDATVGLAIGVADGLPGVARREAAAWMERAASDRLDAAAASSVAATSAAGAAHDSVFDEVLALVAARARRDELTGPTWVGRKPYRALAAYGPEDADLFVGRERVVAELTARVLDRRLVAVVGASGSGKSSIVRAGLDPLVRSGRLPGTAPWRSHVMVPGTDPLGALDAIDRIDEPGPQLVIVDQFEEVAALGSAEAFATRLLDLVLDAALDVHVVLVVRADQFGTVAQSRHLVDLLDDAQVLVGPPSDDELRRIATQPARRTGCTVEPELVELIVADVAGQDGTLPLASAALAEVWERRRDDVLTAEQYLEIGGLAAAVERLGERAMDDAHDADAVRELLLLLVDVTDDGQWVRRRARVADVPPRLAGAEEALVDARLVVRDGGVLDVVHEVVFRAWPRLVAWLEDARADLVIDRDVRIAARAWADRGRSDDDVYRGGRLQAAVEWLGRGPAAGPDVVEFIAASSRVADQEHAAVLARLAAEVKSRRRLSRALVAAAVLLVVSLVGAALAIVGQRSANDARAEAVRSADAEREAAQLAADREREAESQRRGRQAAGLLGSVTEQVGTDPQLATLLAVEANHRFASPDTQASLQQLVMRTVPEVPVGADRDAVAPVLFDGFAGVPMLANSIAVSADGRIGAAGGSFSDSSEGAVLLLDLASRTALQLFTLDAAVRSLDVSDDGRFVLVTTFERVAVIDVAAKQLTESAFRPSSSDTVDGTINSAWFVPSGDQYFISTFDSRITPWDRLADQAIDRLLPDSPLNIAGPTPDGKLAVARGDASNGSVRAPGVGIYDPATGEELGGIFLDLPPGAVPSAFSFSQDQHYLAGAAPDALLVWDLTTGHLTAGSTGAATGLSAIAFDPQRPELLAIGGSDGQLRFYDVAADRNVQPPVAALGASIVDLAFNADGTVLVGISESGLIAVWRAGATDSHAVRFAGPDDPAWQLVGSPSLVREPAGLVVVDPHDPTAPGTPIVPGDTPDDGFTEAYFEEVTLSSDGTTVLGQDFGPGEPSSEVIDLGSGDRFTIPDARWPATLAPDGAHVVAVDPTGSTLTVWDTASRTVTATAKLTDFEIDLLIGGLVASDGRSVLLRSPQRIVRASMPELRMISSAPGPAAGDPFVVEVPGTDDVIVSADGELALVNMTSGAVRATVASAADEPLVNVAVSADGSTVVAQAVDAGTYEVFDASTLSPIVAPLAGAGPVLLSTAPPVISADGTMIAALRADRRLMVWDIDPGSWEASACAIAGRNLTADEWTDFIGPDEPYRATCPQWPSG